MSKPAARIDLEQPHLVEHQASIVATAERAVPQGFTRIVGWFLGEWHDEIPGRLHKRQVWADFVAPGEDRKAEGGSLLGTRAWHEEFRSFVESSPLALDPDGRYRRPLRAAIARLAGRRGWEGSTEDLPAAPFMARFLVRFGSTADFYFAASSMGIPPQVARVYTEQAILRLWRMYEVGPPGRLT